MTRRWLVVCGGLLLGTSLAACSLGEEAVRPPSLAERVAAMSRTWKQKPPANPSHVVQASHTAAARAPQEPAGLPQINPRSLIPTNLFGRSGQEPITGAAARAAQNEQRHASRGNSSQPRAHAPAPGSAAASRAGSARAGSAQRGNMAHNDFTLPGLGRPRSSASNQNAAATRSAQSAPNREQQLTEEYQELSQAYRAATSSRRPQSPVAPETPPAPSSRRSPPSSRAQDSFSAEEMRRELTDIGPIGANQPQAIESSTEITDQAAPTARKPAPSEPEVAESPTPTPFEPTPMNVAQEPLPSNAGTSSPGAERAWSAESRPQEDSRSFDGPQQFAPSSRVASRPVRSISRSSESIDEEFSSSHDGRELLVENQTPVITSDIRGPKQILVGREATYELRLQNQGDFGADEVVASVRIPSGAEVVGTTATRGAVRQAQGGQSSDMLQWHLQRLEAGATETLEVKLIPRNSRPLELGMTWTSAPVGSRAVVEVQEPKLKINVNGPEEVLFGKPQLYRLTLSNPGTGVAENVKIELLPPGGGRGAVTSHRLGTLPAGATKSLEVELTAREPGKLQVKASASAEGGLTTSVAKEIFCRKPELEVDWRGPQMTYAGTEATYFFRVRNPGTATANDVAMIVSLPEGVELVSASEGQTFSRDRGEVSWQVGPLNPGDDFYTEIRCVAHAPGENQLNVVAATATGDLSDSKRAETQVVALADLKLDVTDPTGPVPVGEEAVYEILVQNRGSNTAQDVKIVALFSDGVEPIEAEGAPCDVADGRVAFHTIDSLPAGRQLMLRIRARAVQAGNHVFRAEVLCRDLEIKLAAEETTRFFDDASLSERSGGSESTQQR